MATEKYILEIYEPGSGKSCWVSFSSDTPFMSIQRGQVINPGLWEGSQSPMKVLRVVDVEHIIWENSGIVKHKVCVYTKEVSGESVPSDDFQGDID